MNHLMEDLSFSRLRRLRKNKSEDEPKVSRQTLLSSQGSGRLSEVMITLSGEKSDSSNPGLPALLSPSISRSAFLRPHSRGLGPDQEAGGDPLRLPGRHESPGLLPPLPLLHLPPHLRGPHPHHGLQSAAGGGQGLQDEGEGHGGHECGPCSSKTI